LDFNLNSWISAIEPTFKCFVGQIVFDALGGGGMKGTPPHPDVFQDNKKKYWSEAVPIFLLF